MSVVLPLERQNKKKKSRFSEEEQIAILKQVRAGATVVTTCAKHNIGMQTYDGGSASLEGWKWMRRGACAELKGRTGG